MEHAEYGFGRQEDVDLGVRIAHLAGLFGFKSYMSDFTMRLLKTRDGCEDMIAIRFDAWPMTFYI